MAKATAPTVERLLNDYDALFSGDLEKLDSVSESISLTLPLDEIHGRTELEETIREMNAAFPDMQAETTAFVVDEETVMSEFTWRGTHEGAYEAIPPSGNEVEISGMATLILSDGVVQEDRSYFDARSFLEQLGVDVG